MIRRKTGALPELSKNGTEVGRLPEATSAAASAMTMVVMKGRS